MQRRRPVPLVRQFIKSLTMLMEPMTNPPIMALGFILRSIILMDMLSLKPFMLMFWAFRFSWRLLASCPEISTHS